MGVGESRPKLIFYISAGGETMTNADEAEVKIFLKLKRPRCRSCGSAVGPDNVGYLGIYRGVVSAYCSKCVEAMLSEVEAALALLMGRRYRSMIQGLPLPTDDE
ncbi:hypothetical protein TUZN_0733 [Thermoproteus uzoniensis 768-20]|uniref:Uncharacterized protein n=1 Tax=Thermoproteus uzoniensis (strain 768-20) TaxID=999630 RepID=F2L4P5_THEU7|nr:hypothetical protein [Thermoproteus uzoniensis]AEA12223.1 hypothetical protein TUZN_0733 [Thermoproteus uzoniensis 768-20]